MAFQALANSIGVSTATLGAFLGVAAGIVAVVAIYDALTESVSEAIDKAEKAKAAYEQTKTEIESLNSELETTRDRINELNGKGSLTLVEASELERLQRQNELLEAQLEIKQKLLIDQNKDAADAAYHVLTKVAARTSSSNAGGYGGQLENTDVVTYARNLQNTLNDLNKEYDELKTKQSGLKKNSSEWKAVGRSIDAVSKRIEYFTELRDDALKTIDAQYDTLINSGISEYDDKIDEVADLYYFIAHGEDEAYKKQQQIDGLLNRPSLKKYTEDAKKAAKALNGLTVEQLEEQFPNLARYAKAAKIELQGVVNTINSMAGTVDYGFLRDQVRSSVYASGDWSGFKALGVDPKQWESWIARLSDSQIELLYKISTTTDTSNWSFDDWVESLANAIRATEMAEGPLSNLSDKYVTLSESINGSKEAMDALSEAMGENADEGYEQRVKAYDTINEAFENGEVGSMSNVWDIAEALGASKEVLDGFDPQKLYDWCMQTAQYFTEGQDGVNNFLDAIRDNKDATDLFKEFSWDGENLTFDIDNSNLPELAKVLGLDSNALYDLIVRLGQYYKIQAQTPQDLITYMENLSTQSGTAEEKIQAAKLALEQYAELTGESIDVAKIDAGELGADDFEGETQKIVQAYLDMKDELSKGSDTEGATISLTIDDQQFQLKLSEDEATLRAFCGDDLWNVIIGVDGKTIDTEEKVNAIEQMLETIQGTSVTAKVTDSTGTARANLNTLKSYLQSIKDNAFQTVTVQYKTIGAIPQTRLASGTRNAQSGPALLGDEYSPTGQPKPELVVSGDAAYVAGVNGPTIANLRKGDVVYTADETKQILGGSPRTIGIPAFAAGSGVTWSGGGFRPSSDSSSGTSSGSGSSGGGGSSSSSSSNADNWFEEAYAKHNHLVKMLQEDMADYLFWLDKNYPKAFEEGLIELEDTYSYAEEVFQGLQDLYDDYLNDLEHEISVRDHFKGEADNIVKIYEGAINSIIQEINAAYEAGFKDTDEYMQTLQDQYFTWIENLEEYNKKFEDDANDAMSDLISLRISMIKQEAENEKEALNKRLTAYKEFTEKQKALLQASYDEEDYLEEQAEKRKAVADLQIQLDQISLDNSAWATRRRIELMQELEDAQKELDKFEREHARSELETNIDKSYELMEKGIKAQTDAIDESIKYPYVLRQRAIEDLQDANQEMYDAMIEYNDLYGDGIRKTIVDTWEAAYEAAEKYFERFGSYYEGIRISNVTGVGGGQSIAGSEVVIGGTRYTLLPATDYLSAAASNGVLSNFATERTAIDSLITGTSANSSMVRSLQSGGSVFNMGDIIINGNADQRTVSEIRRAQRDNMNEMLNQLKRLK